MSRLVIGATWDDSAPHLTKEGKEELFNSYPEYTRDARTRGIPQLGAGAVYPFAESAIRVKDIEDGLPKFWRRGFGMDTALSGFTAAVWGALDTETGVVTIYSVYKRSQAETAVHVDAIKSRGSWIPGVGDAAAVIDHDRVRYIDLYRLHGIDLELADKSVEAGITEVYNYISAGKLKVYASCQSWFEEFRLYRRDEKGRIVKQNDHLMDATRYLIRSGLQRMKNQPAKEPTEEKFTWEEGVSPSLSWMR
jgi:Terminase RNaseH-like domain